MPYYFRSYKEFGCGLGQISRLEWIKDWRQELFWSLYLDVNMDYVKDAITEYCEANNVRFLCDCDWLYCVSNRKQYNDIMSIINSILYEGEEDCV